MQNGFIESFNGRLRNEFLNETLFSSLSQARAGLTIWQADYNGSRPHLQLGWQTPVEFASTFNPRRALALRNAKNSGHRAPCHQLSTSIQPRKRTQHWIKLGGKVREDCGILRFA